MVINERTKFLTFNLDKNEMNQEEKNKFLLQLNQQLKQQLKEAEDELEKTKGQINEEPDFDIEEFDVVDDDDEGCQNRYEPLTKEQQKVKDQLTEKYKHLKCFADNCGQNVNGKMLICKCSWPFRHDEFAQHGYTALCPSHISLEGKRERTMPLFKMKKSKKALKKEENQLKLEKIRL